MLLNASKKLLVEGKQDMAFEVLTEAIAVFYQVYGMFRSFAGANIARTYAQGNRRSSFFTRSDILRFRRLPPSHIAPEKGIDHPRKVGSFLHLITYRNRVLGIIHSETANAYNNLALYIHQLDPKSSERPPSPEPTQGKKRPSGDKAGKQEALKYAYHALHLFHLLDIPLSLPLANTHVRASSRLF